MVTINYCQKVFERSSTCTTIFRSIQDSSEVLDIKLLVRIILYFTVSSTSIALTLIKLVLLTQKLLKQGCRYRKLGKTFS